MPRIDEVFGVGNPGILSYVERNDIDDRFAAALKAEQHIVVYGASKQGKTSLVKVSRSSLEVSGG